MRSLQEIIEGWAELENDEMMNLFKKNYGPLPQLSMLFPSWRPLMRNTSILLLITHTILLGVHSVLLIITTVQTTLEWDLEMASLSIHFWLLVNLAIFFVYFMQSQRRIFARQCMCMVGDIGRYRSGNIYKDNWCVEEEKKMKKETYYYLVIPGAIGIGSVYVMLGPYTYNWISGMENPYTPRMVNKNLPFPCWYPFPTHEGVLHLVAVLGQLGAAACLAIVYVQVLLFFLFNTQRIRFEMRVVGYSLKTLFPRSTKMYLRMYPNKVASDIRVLDPQYQSVIATSIKDTVIHHHATAELISLYAEQIDVPGAISFCVGTGVIGMSLFNILEALKVNNISTVILFSVTILCETLVMYILSALGEAITDQSMKLRDELYFVKWHRLNKSNRKLVHIIQTAITEPLVLSAMGLIDLSMETFSSIINTSYSFFNLMNAQTEQ